MTTSSTTEKWYNKIWLVILLCILFFPVGLYALWKSNSISKGWKFGGTLITGILVVAAIANDKDNNSLAKSAKTSPTEIKNNLPVSTNSKTTESNAVATNESETSINTEHKIGDIISFGNYALQVTNFEQGKIYNDVWNPKTEGKKLVAVEVLLTNNSQEKVDYMITDFMLTDENGY